jgi:pimeloyl-ACP methyl ester carboxylesterase
MDEPSTLPAPLTDTTVPLGNGRHLGVVEYGHRGGPAVLYLHGHPGSRLEARWLAGAADRAGIPLIGVDRPGLGRSDYQPKRRLLHWPDDIDNLANRLGLDRFAVLGFSGGAPYALACAYRFPQRLTGCAVVAGVAPAGWFVRMLAAWLPWPLTFAIRAQFVDHAHASRLLSRFARRWPAPDRQVLTVPGVHQVLAASLADAFRQGAKGAARDGSLLGHRWGQPEAIEHPVLLWHGSADRQVPAAVRSLAARLPHCQATWSPDDGHLSVIVNHADEILAALRNRPPSAGRRRPTNLSGKSACPTTRRRVCWPPWTP